MVDRRNQALIRAMNIARGCHQLGFESSLKQPSRGVLRKMRCENMSQIYKMTPMSKWDFVHDFSRKTFIMFYSIN